MKTLILPIGIPGSGKTTYCQMFLAPYIKVVSSDNVREMLYGNASIQGNFREVFGMVYKLANQALDEDGIVCVDATNVSKYARSQAVLNTWPDRLIYIVMNNDLERAFRQNQMRSRNCPERVIRDMRKKLKKEPPQEDRFGKLIPEIYSYEDFSLLEVLNGQYYWDCY